MELSRALVVLAIIGMVVVYPIYCVFSKDTKEFSLSVNCDGIKISSIYYEDNIKE